MSRRATFTEAQVRRAVRAARDVNPMSVIEVTRDGIIRILPAAPDRKKQSDVDKWFADDAC